MIETLPKLITFYLPQFHPIPENDTWWGKGFTEWTNVTRAQPLFRGHDQPHLPADLGFYDLRLPETRQAQAELARAHGIHGFCYYHYWFNGRRVLQRPFDEVLASGRPDFPFCLCWANENWTRAWDGHDREVLLGQNYSDDDDRAHIRWLCRAFRDRRYIRVDGRPLFLVYRVSALPDPARTAAIWREEAQSAGVGELFLCAVECFGSEHGICQQAGFDAAVEFAPDWTALPSRLRREFGWRVTRKLGLSNRAFGQHRVMRYPELVTKMLAKPSPDYRRFPCVTPAWDNTARRRRDALILTDSTPEAYAQWLEETVRRVQRTQPRGEGIVFVNAWNEWAEGNHLEPCQRWGRRYLEATRMALARGMAQRAPQ